VRFFSESPLELGSREADPAPAAPKAQATPAP
jgi:hypothetical protein